MKKQEKPVVDGVPVYEFYVVQRKSKKGKEYKAIVCLDEDGNEHFICYTR